MPDTKLPKRFFRHGHEPSNNNKVNEYSFTMYYRAVMKFLDKNPEQKELLFNSQFGKLLKDGFKVSAQFLHYLLCRQLVIASENEIWILFGGKPFRFSLTEFAVATGLNCLKSPGKSKEDKENVLDEEVKSNNVPYWSEWFENKFESSPKQICEKLKSKKIDVVKRLKLACLLLVDVILLPTSADAKIIDSHVRMIRDLGVFLNHPWGRDYFSFTMKSIKLRKPNDMCRKSMAIQGFISGLQLVALTCIPEIVTFAIADAKNPKKEVGLNPESEDESDVDNFAKALKLNMTSVKTLDTDREVNVSYTLRADWLEGDDLSWSDDEEDAGVLYMVNLLEKNHTFTISSWSGGVNATSMPLQKEEATKPINEGTNSAVAPASPLRKKTKRNTADNQPMLTMREVHVLIEQSAAAQYQKLVEQLNMFDAKFTGLLEQQKEGSKELADKVNALSKQLIEIKPQKTATILEKEPQLCIQNPTEESTMQLEGKEHVEEDVMDVVNKVVTGIINNKGPPEDPPVTEEDGAKHNHTIDGLANNKPRVSFGPPSFSLGLTQYGVSLPKPGIEEAPALEGEQLLRPNFSLGLTQDGVSLPKPGNENAAADEGNQLLRNLPKRLRSKRRPQPILQPIAFPPAKLPKTNLQTNLHHNHVPEVDATVFGMFLKSLESTRAPRIGKGISIARSTFMNLWAQTDHMYNLVMDNLIFMVRARFLEEMKTSTTTPIDFMETEFAVIVSNMHPRLKWKNYKPPKKATKYVENGRQWFTDVDTLYCPYIIDDHWVGLCINLPGHEITVLQPDPTKFDLEKLQSSLKPIAESLPILITSCPRNPEMQAESPEPYTVFNYAGEWRIKRKGSHGVATMLLLELHASNTLTTTSNLDEASVEEAGKNYGIHFFETFNYPLSRVSL